MARFGSREISNVVIKEIATKKPKLYLESLTVSSMEQTAEAVYARGGRGNPKRIMWESDKEVMYNMTDALIQPEALAMLLGSDLATNTGATQKAVPKKEFLVLDSTGKATLEFEPDTDSDMFVFETLLGYDIGTEILEAAYTVVGKVLTVTAGAEGDRIIADYYYLADTKTMSIVVDKFSGYYYLEAKTLWREESTGDDFEAIYTMPRIKFSSNITIENAATGDPATFDFNLEAFPNEFGEMVVIDIVEPAPEGEGEGEGE